MSYFTVKNLYLWSGDTILFQVKFLGQHYQLDLNASYLLPINSEFVITERCNWPPNSPYIILCDVLLCSHWKHLIYRKKLNDLVKV